MDTYFPTSSTSEFSWSVHEGMEVVQDHVTKVSKKGQKGRSQSEKIGRLKYNQQLLRQVLARLERVEQMQRTIVKGLEGMFNFQKPFIQKVACRDEVDAEILDLLFQSQPEGLLPKDVAAHLQQYGLSRFNVFRRVKAMNRRLLKEIGQQVAEKRGHHWALTGFAVEVWGQEKVIEG
jgi:hypothetical protein